MKYINTTLDNRKTLYHTEFKRYEDVFFRALKQLTAILNLYIVHKLLNYTDIDDNNNNRMYYISIYSNN